MSATAQRGSDPARDASRTIVMADDAAGFLTGSTTTPPMIQLLKKQVCRPSRRSATNEELALFISVCRRTQLDPFARQICAVFRWDSRLGDERMSIQTTIDGLRLIAARTREWQGFAGDPLWCDDDGNWHDVWLRRDLPRAARVAVWRAGHREPVTGVAHLEMFRDDRSPMWAPGTKAAHMLAKCAEALALRRAFPQELSGLYTEDEMGAFNDAPAAVAPDVVVEGTVEPDAPQLDAPIVEALTKGVEMVGWDDGRLSMELVDLGLDDAREPRAKLATLTVEQASELERRLNAAADQGDEEAGGEGDGDGA